MTRILKRLYFYTVFVVFRVRIFTRKMARKIANEVRDNEIILEVGSGCPNEKGEYYFSVEKYFKEKKVEFIKSDVREECGVRLIDITKPFAKSEYDRILCFHVLDDVQDPINACINLYNALKPGGYLHIISPVIYPLHDSSDFFRITPFAFRHIFGKVIRRAKIVEEVYNGPKIFPSAFYIKVKKCAE